MKRDGRFLSLFCSCGLPAISLLSTATRPDVPAAGNIVSQPCWSETTTETASERNAGRRENDHEGVRRHIVNAAGVSLGSSGQSSTGKISK